MKADYSGCGCCLFELLILGAVCYGIGSMVKSCSQEKKLYVGPACRCETSTSYIGGGVFVHRPNCSKKVSSQQMCPCCKEKILLQDKQNVKN